MAPKHAPRRTTALPASLREELVSLGHLPKAGKGKLGRKERRKNARNDGSVARAEHFANKKKRKVDDEGGERELEAVRGPDAKKTKVEEEGKQAKMTPLERLLAKQQGTLPKETQPRKKTQAESVEDREIAWLEAKLGVRGAGPPDVAAKKEKGKWKDEFQEDGLDDLFEGIDGLESAAFGNEEKDYASLLEQMSGDEDENDQDSRGDDDDDDNEDDDDVDDDDSEADYGLSDDEMLVPADDDDHDEMGELGSDHSEEQDEEMMLNESDFDSEGGEEEDQEEEEEEEEEENRAKPKKQVRFNDPAPIPSTSTSTSTKYIPPHLRHTIVPALTIDASTIPSPFPSDSLPPPSVSAPTDPRLRRQILGLLNKLSSSNMGPIVLSLESFYASHPRALVSSILTTLLLDIISGRDNLGESFIITYAALVAALSREVGVEFAAGVVAKAVGVFDEAREKFEMAEAKGEGEGEGGFEGRPGSKECENLVAFLAELYNFGVVACVLVYDFVKMFIGAEEKDGLGELEVELLVKIVKRSGQQLRQDDPSSLKEIIGLVKKKMASLDAKSMNVRTRFMIDALTNLKNNKTKPDANGSVDNYSSLKKYISGLKKRSAPEALRLSLSDIRSSSSKGKWWIVGAAWGGDPLVDADKGSMRTDLDRAGGGESEAALTKLARAQGMNTDIRKGVFIVLMSSEDYVDACERLLQLGLTDVQQREIARVLLQCSGNEKTYNPYYTLVAHRMASQSHSFQITLQYCLWDFLRELGEKTVGGEELVKTITDDGVVAKVSKRRIVNLAKLYAWCVAKDVLNLTIFKPVPFGRPRPQTIIFLQQFFTSLLISTQSLSPALILPTTAGSGTTRRDQEAIEAVFVKAIANPSLVKGLSYFLETGMDVDTEEDGKAKGKEEKLVRWGLKIAKEALGVSGSLIGLR